MDSKGLRERGITAALCNVGVRTGGPLSCGPREPQTSRGRREPGARGRSHKAPTSGDVTRPAGGEAGGLAFSSSRGSVSAPGVSFPCVLRLLEKPKTWAGTGWGGDWWREVGPSDPPPTLSNGGAGGWSEGRGFAGATARPRPARRGPARRPLRVSSPTRGRGTSLRLGLLQRAGCGLFDISCP